MKNLFFILSFFISISAFSQPWIVSSRYSNNLFGKPLTLRGAIGDSGIYIKPGTAYETFVVRGIDTFYINNFWSKVRGLFSATAPITYANGLIGITQATASTDGYLNSTDWNTFNNKVGVSSPTNGDLLYYNSGWQKLAIGTSAQTLHVVGGLPAWRDTTAGGGGAGWSLTGNTGITSVSNYLGTTDSAKLRIKTKATDRMTFDSSGNIILPSTNGSIYNYLTTDQTTNYERARIYWNGNIFTIATEKGGSGGNRTINISAPGGASLTDGAGGFFTNAHASNISGYAASIFRSGGSTGALAVTGTYSGGDTKGVAIIYGPANSGVWSALYISPNLSGISASGYLINAGTNTAANDGGTHTIKFSISKDGKPSFIATNTATGTTGAQTINNPSGSVNFAAGAQTLTVTSSIVTTSSHIVATMETDDATAGGVKCVTVSSGSFTIKLQSTCTAETKVSFWVRD